MKPLIKCNGGGGATILLRTRSCLKIKKFWKPLKYIIQLVVVFYPLCTIFTQTVVSNIGYKSNVYSMYSFVA